MGRIGKLLTSVSSAVLLFVGTSGDTANKAPNVDEQSKELPGVRGGAALYSLGLSSRRVARYTEDIVEVAILMAALHDGLKYSPEKY